MRRFFIIFGIILLVFTLIFLYLYQFLGLKYYIRASVDLKKQSGGSRISESQDYFRLATETEYRGIVASISIKDNEGVLRVWGSKGLKIFKIDKSTILSYYKTCNTSIFDKLKNEQTINIDDRLIFNNPKEIIQNTKQGYFVDIFTKNTSDKAVEIYAYDSWWTFLPLVLDDICKK